MVHNQWTRVLFLKRGFNQQRRIVDFISGGVYALDGHIQKISNSIFLIAPMNYEITNEMAREEIKSKLSVSWLKNNNIN